jgi:hypothetical protein
MGLGGFAFREKGGASITIVEMAERKKIATKTL